MTRSRLSVPAPEILVIGYGNVLRGDDGIGVYAARELEKLYHGEQQLRFISVQQLTPEMAEDIAKIGFVLFLDASSSDAPGMIHCAPVEPEPANAVGSLVHHLTPDSLLAIAEKLYGHAPKAMCLTLAGWTFEVANGLSPGAQLRLTELIRQSRAIIGEWQAERLLGPEPPACSRP
jgi:hydrogenase maturation protease